MSDPEQVLSELDRLRIMARGDRRPSSVPLVVFGALTLLSAPLFGDGMLMWRAVYWAVAGPAGFLFIALWYRKRRLRTGGGSGRGSYVNAGLLVLASFLLVLPLLAIQIPTIALALLVLALLQRNVYLVAFAVVFGVVGAMETFAIFDNMAYRLAFHAGWFQSRDGYFSGAPTAIYGLLGLVLLAAGLVARSRERRFSRG